MDRSTRFPIALCLLTLIGCGSPAEPLDAPGTEPPQYGAPAGTGAEPIGPEAGEPGLGDPGQPPVEADVPTGAGGSATAEEDPGAFILNPPSDLEQQPLAPEPAPTADPSEESGSGQL